MRRIIFISLLLCSCFFTLAQGTGYVRLQGRQFIDRNGNPFYPLLCNYSLDMLFISDNNWNGNKINPVDPNDINELFLSPNWRNGPNDECDCIDEPSCLQSIQEDFDKIKSMGFNCIRLTGAVPRYDFERPDDATLNGLTADYFYIYTLPIDEDPMGNWKIIYHQMAIKLDRLVGYLGDPYYERYIELLDAVIAEAEGAGLGVMIDVCPEGLFNETMWPDVVEHYDDFLTVFGDHYKNDQTLMAYIIVEEPMYTDRNIDQHSKQQLCEAMNQWYDALKAADLNHLIAIGGFDIEELWNWDVSVLKMDFYKPHYYINYRDYENRSDNTGINRLKGHLWWLKNNCPLPWMTGEIGYKANDNITNHFFHPDGTEQQQKDYLHEALQAVLDYGGSGYSHWIYQDSYIIRTDSGQSYITTDGYGLLGFGEIPSSPPELYDKPAVQEYSGYLDPTTQMPVVPANPAACIEPDDYYDPYRTAYFSDLYFPSPPITPVNGTVTDQNAAPIKDAVLKAHVFTSQFLDDISPGTPHWPIDNAYYTFTNGNQTGSNYSITPFEPVTNDAGRQYIRWMEVTASGCSKVEVNSWGWNGGVLHNFQDFYYDELDYSYPPNVTQTDFPLQRLTLVTNETVQNQTINNTNSPATFAGRLTLTASITNEIQYDGTADFYALNEVHLTDEFHAASGSEVHIYNAPLYVDCDNDFPSPPFRAALTHEENQISFGNFSIVVQFIKTSDEITVNPNPNEGFFTIAFNRSSSSVKQLKCFDLLGNLVRSERISESSAELNFFTLPKGIYYLLLTVENNIYYKKIIIQ